MNKLGRHPRRDALLLSASHDGGGDIVAEQADMQGEVPRGQAPLGEVSPRKPFDLPSIRIEVRRARLTDVLDLSRFPDSTRYELNQPASSQTDSDPVRAALRSCLPFSRHHQPLFVATSQEERHLMGYAQFRVAGPDQRWITESIGASVGVYDAEPVVAELLAHAVKAAGLSGVRRLYARSEPDAPIQAPLRHIGFSPYARERIMGSTTVPLLPAARGARIQTQSDVWAIHQLYLKSTPREVQHAEGLTSHSWDVDAVLRRGRYGCRGWLVADDYLALAYARITSRSDAHVIEVMVSQEHYELFPILFSAVAQELAAVPARRTYVVLRHYQTEFVSYLEELGFVSQNEQDVFIRYTTASVRSSAVAAGSAAIESQPEPVAKRVPTFFNRSADTCRIHGVSPDADSGYNESYGAF